MNATVNFSLIVLSKETFYNYERFVMIEGINGL